MASSSTDTEAWAADDAAALALEQAWAQRASAPLRAAGRAVAVLLLAAAARARAQGGSLTREQQARLREQLLAALAALAVGIAVDIAAAVAAGRALALRQEGALLRAAGIEAAAVRGADPVLERAGAAADASIEAALARLRAAIGVPGALESPAALEALAARALAPASSAQASARWAVNRAINSTTLALARTLTDGQPPLSVNGRTPLTAPGMVVVWVAERDACLVCLALSGDTLDPVSGSGFDEEATFDPRHRAPIVWPPGMPLMGPPRHPNCRCRLRIIAADNTSVPAALKREAERSVARGWSGHASRRSRLGAADVLVRRANRLPRTVNERAARDAARGEFSSRHRPRAPHLRAR